MKDIWYRFQPLYIQLWRGELTIEIMKFLNSKLFGVFISPKRLTFYVELLSFCVYVDRTKKEHVLSFRGKTISEKRQPPVFPDPVFCDTCGTKIGHDTFDKFVFFAIEDDGNIHKSRRFDSLGCMKSWTDARVEMFSQTIASGFLVKKNDK